MELFDVEPDVRGVPAARRAVTRALDGRVPQDVCDAAQLVVTELVGNAVMHGAPPVQVAVDVRPGTGEVRLEVHDRSHTLPVRPQHRLEGLTGRGLGLVDAVAASWGIDATSTGKAVWAELTPASVAAAQPTRAHVEDLLTGVEDWQEVDGEQRYTVRLGDVPTDLLLDAKAHIDSVVRELTLTAAGARAGMIPALPAQLAGVVHDVVEEFAEARRMIKAQAVAAAEAGEPRTHLVLTLPASAAESGVRYLAALERADAYAREERLLTLAAPPQHRAFRRWYIGCLVDGLRRAAADQPAVAPPSFETHLLREIDHLATLQQVSERSARLQRVTAALSGALGRVEVARVVLEEALAELGGGRGVLLVADGTGARAVAQRGWSQEQLTALLQAWRLDRRLPCTVAWSTGTPVWVESRSRRDEEFPALAEVDPALVAACAVPLPVAGHLAGVLAVEYTEPRAFSEDERAFLVALGAVGAQAFERADLYDAQSDLARRLTRLQSVTAALTSASGLDDVLDVVLEHATGLVGARNASVSMLQADGRTLQLVRMVPPPGPDVARWLSFDVDEPVPAAEAVRAGEVLLVRDVEERDRRWPTMAGFARDFEHALVAMPLRAEGRVVGAVTLSFPSTGQLPDVAFLQAFADSCGQAVERSRSGERAQAATRRLQFLARASQELTESLDVERTLGRIAHLAVPEVADWCVLHLLQDGELHALAVAHVDPDKTAAALEVQRRWPERMSDPTGVAEVVRTGEPLLVPDIPAATAALEAAGVPLPERHPEHEQLLAGLGLESCLVVPLTARGRTLGALTFITAESGRHYDGDDLAFALDLARRAATALDNARLFTAAAERAVATGLPGDAADAAPEEDTRTARLLETMTDAFFRLDTSWRFAYVNGQAERVLRRGREELLGQDLWEQFPEGVGSPFERAYRDAAATGRSTSFEAFFEPLGLWFEVRATPDAEGLSVFFHDVTVRKRAEQARGRAAQRLALLAEATRELVGALDATAVLERLGRVLVPRLATWSVAALVDGEGRLLAAHGGHADDAADAALTAALVRRPALLLQVPAVARVLETGEPDLVQAADLSLLETAGPEVAQLVDGLGFASALVVPLRTGDVVLGVIAVVNDAGRPRFEADDLEIAADLGARAGLAVQNALLFERQRRAVEVLQRNLLSEPPDPPQLQIEARYRAAAREAQVGGDWYDAFQQPDGATVLVIGDVMGHDVRAAAAMGQLRSLLRGTAYDRQESPARVLSRVDAALRGLRIDTLATVLVARLEHTEDQAPGTSTLRWASAGHPPAVLRRTDGEVVALDGEDDLLLGLDPDAVRHDLTVELHVGDTLLLYTDGLVERRDSPLAEGVARLLDAVRELGDLPLGAMCDALLARLLPDEPSDDVALVAVRPVLVPEPLGP